MKWRNHKLIEHKVKESENYIDIQDQGKLKLCRSYALIN